MRPVLIFANPIAGRGKGKKIAQRLEQRLRSEGYAVRVFLERANGIKRSQLDPDAVAAIVIGGDGTVRAVADRLFGKICKQLPGEGPVKCGPVRIQDVPPGLFDLNENPEPPVLDPPLLVIPMGTANLMGKHLGLQWNDEHVE